MRTPHVPRWLLGVEWCYKPLDVGVSPICYKKETDETEVSFILLFSFMLYWEQTSLPSNLQTRQDHLFACLRALGPDWTWTPIGRMSVALTGKFKGKVRNFDGVRLKLIKMLRDADQVINSKQTKTTEI